MKRQKEEWYGYRKLIDEDKLTWQGQMVVVSSEDKVSLMFRGYSWLQEEESLTERRSKVTVRQVRRLQVRQGYKLRRQVEVDKVS